MHDLTSWARAGRSTRGSARSGRVIGSTLIATLVWSLVLAPAQALAAPACEAPSSWPLGHHPGEFAQNGSGPFQTSGGWDPAFFTKHQANKSALTRDVQTYRVGLPGSQTPANLKKWTGSCEWSNASLANAGMPRISLRNEAGNGTIDDVYLVAGYNMQGCTIWLQPGVKVAVWGSAFKDVRTLDQTGGVWVVDSLIDVDTYAKGPFRGGEKNSTCNTHVLYSEQMGGLDVGKTHNMTYYRNHLHGSMKVDDGHADGLQINSTSKCAFIYENNVDFLFRMTNRALFLQNSNPAGIHDTWVVNNLISGGANAINTCEKDSSNAPRFGPCVDSVVCGNRVLAADRNTSWANPSTDESKGSPITLNSGDGISGNHYKENNGFFDGKTHTFSLRDNEGDTHTLSDGARVPAGLKSTMNARIALMEAWAFQIRSAAGGDTGPPNNNPVPPPSETNAPAPPYLLE